tara:strand:+ start:1290 stop:2528 length:1239 start_codon:yes stop_codon:yes gene_type:complete
MSNQLKYDISIFSGGRGNKNLFGVMSKSKNINELSVIINGLDDGASTGEIRRLFQYQAHGISDFLKAILSLTNNKDLVNALDCRFPSVNNFEQRLELYKDLDNIVHKNIFPPYLKKLEKLSSDTKKSIIEKFNIFFNYFYKMRDEIVDIEDFKVGNILFAAIMIEKQLSFKDAISAFSSFCNLNKNIQIYPNSHSVRYLTGILKNGTLLPNEASVVLTRTSDSIQDIYQLSNPITMNQIRKLSSVEIDQKIEILESLRSNPDYNEDIKSKILESDIIIYGSGTPYSSILPSLETSSIANFIEKNNNPKVMIANLVKETNNFLSVEDLIEDLYRYLNRSSNKKLNPKKLLTHVIISNNQNEKDANFISSDERLVKKHFPWIEIIKDDFIDPKNSSAHNGEKVFDAILNIIDNK